jgi:hypothetical protein
MHPTTQTPGLPPYLKVNLIRNLATKRSDHSSICSLATQLRYLLSDRTAAPSLPFHQSTIMSASPTPSTYEDAYFQVKPEDVAAESLDNPFDIIIIGSGIGGGVLATALLEKNLRVLESGFRSESTPDDPTRPNWKVGLPLPTAPSEPKTDEPKRILVIEKGRLTFHTHSMNGPRPSNSGTTSQGNDIFYQKFKEPVDMDESSKKIWMGGPVHCLGGRGAVWGLFAPR